MKNLDLTAVLLALIEKADPNMAIMLMAFMIFSYVMMKVVDKRK